MKTRATTGEKKNRKVKYSIQNYVENEINKLINLRQLKKMERKQKIVFF